jgi:hypothetical protein
MKDICLYQFTKKEYNIDTMDSYIRSYNLGKTFQLNSKRRMWHVRNTPALLDWARGLGVNNLNGGTP